MSKEERVYRVRVVDSFLKARIPLSEVDNLRNLLEGGLRLSHSSHLANFIPLLLKQEMEKLRAEVQGTVVSAIFDGMIHNGEALAVVLRFVKEGKIEQTLVC